MPQPLPPIHADPDFRPVVGNRVYRPTIEAGRYRRILFNPFLGFVSCILWWIGLEQGLEWAREKGYPKLIVMGLAAATGYLLPRTFRYHCMDCGGGGRAWRWRQHLCPRIARRIVSGEEVWPRPPGPMVQAGAWIYVLAMALAASRR